MLWLLIPSHLLFALAGALVYRKHGKKAEALRKEAEEFAAKCKAEAAEWKAKFEAIKKATKG